MANRGGGKAPMPTTMTPKSAVARAKPRSGGRFTPAGKTITAASIGGASIGGAGAGASRPQTGGKSGIAQYYNSGKPSSEGRVRKPLPNQAPATPTKAGGGGGSQRQYIGGKFVPGYSPQGFGSGPRTTYDSESDDDDDDDEEEEEEEAEVQPEAQQDDDDEDEYDEYGVKIKKELKLGEADSDFQPDDEYEDVADEDDLGIASIEDFVPARGRGGEMVGRQGSRTDGGVGSYSNGKVHYKKKIRKDSSRFTTTTAMIDADDEFHPKVAAFMGRKIVGTGNGRSAGRKLIRWTPATDQLLLLCFHHELAMMREDLPYEQVAERMFPEKCATGGAVKERFAKLRIEMLNRGSWVPPIIGKSPQGIRPNVRGVVRVAPGVDKGRYVLWKEDASKLIDPKDINKGYSLAQSKGQEYPPRVWISNEAKEEFYTKKRELEQKGLKPLANLPVDYAEDEGVMDASESDRRGSMEGQYNEDEDMDEDELVTPVAPIATPNRKRKMQGDPTPSAKRSVAKARGHSARKVVSHEDDDDDVFGPGPADGSPRPQTRQTRHTPAKARPIAAFRSMAPSPEGNLRGGDSENKMMSFDKDEKAVPARRVVILTRIPSRVLAKFPRGQQGPGTDKYYLDEVKDRVWVGLKKPDVEVKADVDAAVYVDSDLPETLVDSPDHFLFNSGITPPSDAPFWKASMEIHELVAVADKVVAEETRPADILMQVFDGQRFWTVADVIEEFKANTNEDTGHCKDINVWYRCATILLHATQGDQYEDANLLQAKPMAQQNQQFQEFFPDQNAMVPNMNAHANVGFNPVQQNYDMGFVDTGNQSFQNMLHGAGDYTQFNANVAFQNDMGMNVGMNNIYNQANYQGQNMQIQNMFPAGDMNMGGMNVGMDMADMNMAGMNNFDVGNAGVVLGNGMVNFLKLQSPAPEMSIEDMSQFAQIPGADSVDASAADRGADGETVVDSPDVKDEAASPAPKPDVEMS